MSRSKVRGELFKVHRTNGSITAYGQYSVKSLPQFNYIKMNDLRKSNRKAMNRNWSNQKTNPALKTKAGSK